MALKGAELVPGEGRAPLAPETLGNIAREYLLAEAVVERTARIIDSTALYAMLGGTKVDLSSEIAAQRSAEALEQAIADPAVKIESRYDAATESRRLLITRTHHGTPHYTAIDADFLASGDGGQIHAAAEVLQGLVSAGGVRAARREAAARALVQGGARLAARRGARQRLDPALQGLGRNESRAALGDDDGPEGPPPAAACRSRTRSPPTRSSTG